MRGWTAVVTGSTSGIGAGIAGQLAAAGCNIVLNGFGDADAIEAQRRSLAESHGVTVAYDPADMRDGTAIARMITDAETRFGSVDVLVNNAGIQHVAPIQDFAVDRWDAVIAINLSSAFHSIRAAIPGMYARGRGRIVNIASAHGLVASANKAAYVSAKHGIIGLTKVVALEAAKTPVTCNAICPGWVRTPLVEKQIQDRAAASGRTVEEEATLLLSEKEPTLRFTSVEDIGAMVVFLGGEAGANITGTSFSLDGGWTAQ